MNRCGDRNKPRAYVFLAVPLTVALLIPGAVAAAAAPVSGGVADLPVPTLSDVLDAAGEGPRRAASAAPIKDRYIVRFTSSASSAQLAAAGAGARGRGGKIRHEFRHALKGFAATLPAAAVEVLRQDPRVLSVEPDVEVAASVVQIPTPSWGLDRIDEVAWTASTRWAAR